MQQQTWRPEQYNTHASFVSKLGTPVVDLLHPQQGERILDLGCGDGTLAAQIQGVGAKVIGVDSSPEMVAATQARGIEAFEVSGDRLSFKNEFDAVFTNATLHWIPDYKAVLHGVNAALKAGGRFVGEFGGEGNVRCLIGGIERVLARNPDLGIFENPWFFPNVAASRKALEAGGFEVLYIELIPRPTPLKTGVREWFKIFADHIVSRLNEEQKNRFLSETEDEVRQELYDNEKGWFADYVRLRFAAVKKS